LKLEPDNHEARKSLSELSRRKFADVISTPDPDPQELADLFIEAAELTDDQHLLQRQVGFLYRQRDRIPAAKKVVELVAKSPRTQSAILEAAGTAAAEAGNYDQAKTYLQDAVKKDPKNASAWNNYAFIVSQGGKPEYQDALQAVNKAIEILPEEYHFRETRGQILVNLKKWKEAIPDLEFAVNGMPTSPEIHAALALAYEAIGEDQLARLHRQQSQ
jgi:tetratricopeptide (TPR) repeat protein